MRMTCALLIVAALLPRAVAAQTPADPAQAAAHAAAPTAAPDDAGAEIARLQQQLALRSKAVSEDTALSPAARQAEQSALQAVEQQLQSALADRAATAQLVQQRLEAPAILNRLASGGTLAPPIELPAAWSDGTLAQLEAVLAEVNAAAQAASQRASMLRDQLSDLSSRTPLLAAELATSRQALATAQAGVGRAVPSTGAASGGDGEGNGSLLTRARIQALLARIALLEEERDGSDLLGQLLTAELADAEKQIESSSAELGAVRDVVARRRLSDAVGESSEWQATPVGHYREIEQLAETNRQLAALYVGPAAVTHEIDRAQAGLSAIERTAADFSSYSQNLSSRLSALGRSVAAGVLIRESLRGLPRVSGYEQQIAARQAVIDDAQVRIVELTAQRRRLDRDFDGAAGEIVREIVGLRQDQRQAAREVVGALLRSRSQILDPLVRDLERYVGVLVDFQDQERAFVAQVRDTAERLRGQEPWVRNARPVSRADFEDAFGGLGALAETTLWAGSGSAIRAAMKSSPWAVLALLSTISGGVLLLVTLHRRRQGSVLADAASRSSRNRTLTGALLTGLAVTTILASLGLALSSIADAPPGVHVLGMALLEACLGGFAIGLFSALFARRGGVADFRPDLEPLVRRGREAVWLLSGILALVVTSRLLFGAHADGPGNNADLAARLCLQVSALLMVVMLHRVGVQKVRLAAASGRRGERIAWSLAYVAGILLPATFLLLLLQGFLIGALELTRSLLGTLLIVATATTVRAMIMPAPGEVADPEDETRAALRRGRDRLRHLALLLVTLVLMLWIWREVVVAFDYLQNVALWSAETSSGVRVVTVANLLACIGVMAGTFIAFWGLPLVAGTQSLDTVSRGVGTRYAVVTLVRYVVLLLGVLVAFAFLNVGWSKIQWLATGLSVGLGFGLQEIVANFFSGLILLSERSIRVGDLVAVGDQTGIVTRIHVRATTVRDFDGREILIPNKEMIAAQVTNWTLSNTRRRLQLVVGVAYGSDTALVERLLLDAALRTPGVLADPAPSVAFELFGDSALQFRLYCWIAAADRAVATNHLLHVRIEEVLRTNGITIPFPQRDLHLDTAAPLEIQARDKP